MKASTKASTTKLADLGARMKLAREAVGLTQAAFHEQYGYGSARTYQKNEAGTNEAGVLLAESFVRAGINANWLLTGEGPMRLADLMARPEPPRLNIPALTAILEGLLKAGAPPEKAVAAAFEFYQLNIDRGLITADGIGAAKKNTA